MPFLALWASLLFVSAPAHAQAQAKATPQTVSLVDVLVEGQTLYTMAVDKQRESLTAALDLAHQAQRAVADDTVKKRLPAGAKADAQDLTVLGALRARIGILVSTIEKRREYFNGQFQDIQKLVQRKRLDDAQSALDSLPADTPTADPACPFADLRADVTRGLALVHTKSSGSTPNKRLVTQGILWTGLFAGAGLAAQVAMSDKQNEMFYVPPGSDQWWALYDDSEQLRKIRNGLYVAAFGVGTAFTIYGAVRANRSPGRALSPFGPRTWVGFNIDPHRPAIMVVRIF